MRPVLLLLSLVAGCTQFPDLDRRVAEGARAAPYPDLVPFDTLPAPGPDPVLERTKADLAARNAALRQRADELRNTPL